ncbi:MAG TPA: Spy/CpxP family protein refolding chaperone [Burkholderiaceae bacterium]
MRPWIKRTLYGLVGASVLVGGLTGCGHGYRHGGEWPLSEADAQQMRERLIDRVSRELTLDDAQKQRLGVLADKLREQRLALVGANNADPRTELRALVSGTTFDRTRAQALVEAKTAAVRTKSPEVIAAMADFYDSLRPEQQQKVRDFMAKRHRGWRG